MTINYISAIRAANNDSKAINQKILAAHTSGDCNTTDIRAAFNGYRAAAAALIMAAADFSAIVDSGEQPTKEDNAAIIAAAKKYFGYFASDVQNAINLIFEVDKKENNAAAAMRIAARVGKIAIDGKAKTIDGKRRGAINLTADGKATATIMTALEQYAIDRIDDTVARNAAAMIDDKKARRAALAEKRAAAKAKAEKK